MTLFKEPQDPAKVCDQDTITQLAPKPVWFYPDPVRFPPINGERNGYDECGCLMTKWKDYNNRDIKLETIWQPLWSVLAIGDGAVSLNFFQGGGNERDTNLTTAGELTWPKRFHCWEIELTVADEERAESWAKPSFSPMVSMRIGEKNHFKVSFSQFYKVPGRFSTYSAPLPLSLFIPSRQNFCVQMDIPERSKETGSVKLIRCSLNGYLHREIP